METKKFKAKAAIILQKLTELVDKKEIISEDGWDTIYSPDAEIYEAEREFVHLAYAFDKDLPLYKDLREHKVPEYHLGDDLEKRRKDDILWYIDKVKFFIYYIEEYIEG